VPEEDMTADQLEIKKIAEKWTLVRVMDADQVAALEPEWQEAHARYFEKYNRDMEYATEVTGKVKNMIEPDKIQKKSKSQKKRDKWAIVSARDAYRKANPVHY
jgi:hypothetical protein